MVVAASALIAAGATPRWVAAQSAGRVESRVIQDSTFHRARRVWVYTPPRYQASGHAPYDLMIVFDGQEYLDAIPLPKMLDSLAAAGAAPPFVAVLVDDSTRGVRLGELANVASFASFVGDQLMPWVQRGWNVTRDPHRTIITGSSAGGLASAFLALRRPDLFGNVLSQSGAVWRGPEASNAPPFEWLATQYAAAPRKDIRFVVDIGALETVHVLGGTGPSPVDASRRFVAALRAKGYPVTYTEVPNAAHAPQFWRPRLAGDIVSLTKEWP